MKISTGAMLPAVGLTLNFFSMIACGGAQSPREASVSPAPRSQEGEPAPPPSLAWKDMNHAQRLDYMKRVVYPKMKDEFTAFDVKRFGEMTCVTCHGDSAKDGSFKMPNPKLPKLPADEAGFKALMQKQPVMTKFMGGKVVPGMASLLGEAPVNPQTPQGFGCFECHTK